MHLHRRFGNADIVGNLFVQATGRDMDHDLTLAGAERFETRPERMQGPIILATGAIASEAGLDRVEEILITERFCEELYGTALHRLYGHRDVAMRRDENDRQLPVRRGKVALKLKAASPRHSNVEDQTSRAVRQGRHSKSRKHKKIAGYSGRPTATNARPKSRNSGSSSMIKTLGFASRIPGPCVEGSAFFCLHWLHFNHNPST